MTQYTQTFEKISGEIDQLMGEFHYTKKDLGYGTRWIFKNGMRFDMIDYVKRGQCILRVGRGAWLVRHYPILYSRFDEVNTVIAKLEIVSVEVLYEKDVLWVLKLLEQAPRGVKAV